MVGGTVVSADRLEGYVMVGVEDRTGERLYIDLEYREGGAASAISPGDQIWWQGDFAFWTPKGGTLRDHKIRRLSYSYSLSERKPK